MSPELIFLRYVRASKNLYNVYKGCSKKFASKKTLEKLFSLVYVPKSPKRQGWCESFRIMVEASEMVIMTDYGEIAWST